MSRFAGPRELRHSVFGRSAGFTLIEVLIGMAIALIGMVFMFQTMQAWEGRKRTSASGSDAQISGAIALYSLERDIKMSGYGFGNAAAMGCTVNAYDSTRPNPGTFTFQMAPILIADGVGGLPDAITVLYGSGDTMSSAQTFNNTSPAPAIANDTFKRLNNRTGLRAGDILIAADSGNLICGLFEVTANGNADGITVDHGAGAYLNYVNNENVAASSTLAPAALAQLQAQFLNNTGSARYNNGTAKNVGATGSVFNMGTLPQLNGWQITNGRLLTVANTLANPAGFTEVSEGIVNLQAEYGVDGDGDGLVDDTEWAATVPADWTLLRAVRVAVLARSQQYEQTAATLAAPTWGGGAFTMFNLDGSAGVPATGTPNDWRHYRYRVFETVIPLRNMLWGID